MRQFLLTCLVLLPFYLVNAQSVSKAKELLRANKLVEAKKEIDAVMAMENFQKDGEGHYTKAKIYSLIFTDATGLNDRYPDAGKEAFKSIKKYTELTELKGKTFISLQIDEYKPLNDIYTGFYQFAANHFNQNNYTKAYDGFVDAIAVSYFMYKKGWTNIELDTNSVLYAAISAVQTNQLAEAARYYGVLADGRVKRDGFIENYKWVATYYYEIKLMAMSRRYLSIGREVYPTDPFWTILELDIARQKGDKAAYFSIYDKVIKENPGNHLYLYHYAGELYQYAYNTDQTKRPSNSEISIAKTQALLKEVIRLESSHVGAQMFSGQVIYNSGIDILISSKASTDEQKKNELKTAAWQKFKSAESHFLSSEKLLTSKTKLQPADKTDLQEVYQFLITFYHQSGDKPKMAEYEQKFNALGKN